MGVPSNHSSNFIAFLPVILFSIFDVESCLIWYLKKISLKISRGIICFFLVLIHVHVESTHILILDV